MELADSNRLALLLEYIVKVIAGRTSPSQVSVFLRECDILLDARRVAGRTSPSLEYKILLDARRVVGSVRQDFTKPGEYVRTVMCRST